MKKLAIASPESPTPRPLRPHLPAWGKQERADAVLPTTLAPEPELRLEPEPRRFGGAQRKPPTAYAGNVSLKTVRQVRVQLTWLYNRCRKAILRMEAADERVPTDYYRAGGVLLREAKDCIMDHALGEKLERLEAAVKGIERGDRHVKLAQASPAARLPGESAEDDAR